MISFSPNWIQQGWQCPICLNVYSPQTMMCFHCTKAVKQVIGTGTGSPPPQPEPSTGQGAGTVCQCANAAESIPDPRRATCPIHGHGAKPDEGEL